MSLRGYEAWKKDQQTEKPPAEAKGPLAWILLQVQQWEQVVPLTLGHQASEKAGAVAGLWGQADGLEHACPPEGTIGI